MSAIVAAVTPGTASAFVWCTGPLSSVTVDVNGYLYLNWGYGDMFMCNTNADTTMPAPQGFFAYKTCQGVYSMALTAKSTGKDLWVSLPAETTCAGLAPNASVVANKALGHFRVN